MSESRPSVIEPISFPTAKIVPKAWGSETWVVNIPEYCLKLLRFKAGAAFSTHFHWSKVESWTAYEGQLRLDYFDLATSKPLTRTLNPGDVVHIPAGNPHKLTAITDALILEASTTHRDEDSYRIAPGASQGAQATFSRTSSDRGSLPIAFTVAPNDTFRSPGIPAWADKLPDPTHVGRYVGGKRIVAHYIDGDDCGGSYGRTCYTLEDGSKVTAYAAVLAP